MTVGLYNPSEEHDACGLAFVATLKKESTRQIVEDGLEALLRLDHRGAVGAEENTGDGAGILVSVPDEFLRSAFSKENVQLPEQGKYAVGIAFMEQNESLRKEQFAKFEKIVTKENLSILGFRNLPIDDSAIGSIAKNSMPYFVMFAIGSNNSSDQNNSQNFDCDKFERKVYRARKIVQNEVGLYFASLSSKTITYKGMLTTKQLPSFFLDLQNEKFAAKIALVHSRFSTNTLPSWQLAQPLRNIAHNGEINTIRGNRNWLNARQGTLESPLLGEECGGEIKDIFPILTEGTSDSTSFDEVLELLHQSGRSLEHSVLMMIPPAYENDDFIPEYLKAFYQHNSTMIEPWDGPASLSFTDGNVVGAILDRNGFRPGRFWVTEDKVVMASEVGVLDIDDSKIIRRGRLEPGKMLLVDTNDGRIVEDEEIKRKLSELHPYQDWIKDNTVHFSDLPEREHVMYPAASVEKRQRAFGYTEEEIKMILSPMAQTGKEPLGAMGTDTPIAVLSSRPRLIFDYFTQDFAQVTNPPLDSIREEIVTSIASAIGPEPNLLEDKAEHSMKLSIPFPVIDNDQLARIEKISSDQNDSKFKGIKIEGLFEVPNEMTNDLLEQRNVKSSLEQRLEEIFAEIDQAIENGINIIILSDRNSNQNYAPIPSLLLTSAVQHHLIRQHTRTKISLIVEAGDVRETHHVALLIGYGAACVNPYLAMESVENLARQKFLTVDAKSAVQNLIKALGNGVLKIMSKMGISTIMSYRGSQVFGAVGLSKELIDQYFTGTTSKIGGVTIEDISNEVLGRHAIAFPKQWTSQPHRKLRTGGEYKWRKTGEEHLFNPESIFHLQQSTKNNDFEQFQKFSKLIDDQSEKLKTIRGLFKIKSAQEIGRTQISLDEVESVESIMKRFSTGAMSYGSISIEAHRTLAEAMNRIGARSNSGEGGEEIDRLYDEKFRSKIKQVASGRFGVTSEYLVSADDLQIKLAQGAKPGEGGHLPGEKVYPWIAKVRHSTPGVDLVSPPPHHDIYSIEDLAQLIHDLKMANPKSRVHVKLVSEYGVGTIAAGVSKAHADVILISGHDGGTGAAPLSSIKHAGQPWEIGLAETQQTLVQNDLRDRVVVQTDGQLKTGRDVLIAALLGAEEFGFATAPLVVEGCVMMRVCNKNTCPVGIATQNPELRKNFTGTAQSVENYFRFVAQEVRILLSQIGFRTLEEVIGVVDVLDTDEARVHYKSQKLDLGPLFHKPCNSLRPDAPNHHTKDQNHELEKSLDAKLIPQIPFDDLDKFSSSNPFIVESKICNVDRTFGATIAFEITSRFNSNTNRTLEDDALQFDLQGIGGQSLGAFIPKGVKIKLFGECNDYVAKGISGGKIVIRPLSSKSQVGEMQNNSRNSDVSSICDPHDSIIAGNVIGFGATSGTVFLSGVVGERFAVRNSGATFVCEGTGDHALEYMTGGKVLILGKTGKNIGSGFLGGKAYVLDLDKNKITKNAIQSNVLTLNLLSELSLDEQNDVRKIVEDFIKETDSKFAKHLLKNWDQSLSRITRIIPTKYLKISQIEDVENNWDQILEIIKT